MILLSELPAASCEPRQSDATKKIVPQRKSSGVRSSGTFQNSAAARYVLIKIQTTFHYIVADPESRNA